MVELMAQNLEIKYNHVVKKVEYGTQGVRVITDQGDVIEADAAVVTLPLGILKSGYVSCMHYYTAIYSMILHHKRINLLLGR